MKKRMKKRTISIICAIITLFGTVGVTGCKKENDDKISIVATTFPVYDWTRQVLGEKIGEVELTFLIDGGTDLHSYQPTVEDIVKINDADVFVYIGGESDEWVDDVFNRSVTKSVKKLSTFDALEDYLLEEEAVDGSEHDEHEHEHEHEIDEHVWLSLKNAAAACRRIAKTLGEVDSENADIYTKNANAYCEKLQELDDSYKTSLEGVENRTLLFADRFPFRYLFEDYDLKYYAAFSGCSAESEATAEMVAFLVTKFKELGLKTVMQTESSDGELARTIINNAEAEGVSVLTLDSMQSVTAKNVSEGVTYLKIMQNNLSTLISALK